MKKLLHIRDLLDTLYFLGQDDGTRMDEVNRGCMNGFTGSDDRDRLRHWLQARRQAETEHRLPGHLFASASTFLSIVLLFFALTAGFGGVFSFLAYTGKEPVNVLVFFALFIFIQGILAIGSALPLAFQVKAPASLSPFGVMMGHALSRIMEKGLGRLPAERRIEMLGLWRRLRSDTRAFGRTLFYLVFSRVQFFATLFACGALSAFLTRILFFDTAFGWQTTLNAAPEMVHRLAQALALPWSWCFPDGTGVPHLDAVAGSRMVLKEGIEKLSGAHLTAWWPFLAMGLLVYGVLPRGLLLLISRGSLKKAVDQEIMALPQVKLFIRVLSTPALATEVTEAHPAHAAEAELALRKKVTLGNPNQPVVHTQALTMVLVPSELADMVPRISLLVGNRVGRFSIRIVSMESPLELPDTQAPLYLIQEAWQAPIRETLDWIIALKSNMPDDLPLTVLLTGELGEETSPPPEESHVHIWTKVIAALVIPGLRVTKIEGLSIITPSQEPNP